MSEKQRTLPHGDFYEALGRAVASWQLIEGELLRLLTTLFLHEHNVALEKMFYSVPNIRDKLGMVNAAALSKITDEPTLNEWNAIKNAVDRKRREYRNPTVHGQAWVTLIGPEPLRNPYIGPPRDPLRSLDAPPDESKDFDAERLMVAARAFSRIAKRIHDFRVELAKRAASQ